MRMWKKENSELCVVAYVSMRHKLQLAKCIISAFNDYIDAHCTCYMESRCVVLDNSSDSVITNRQCSCTSGEMDKRNQEICGTAHNEVYYTIVCISMMYEMTIVLVLKLSIHIWYWAFDVADFGPLARLALSTTLDFLPPVTHALGKYKLS